MTSAANLSVASLFGFKDHVVLVTGGASGLGEMAAQAFVQNGARVFIASRKEGQLKEVRVDLERLFDIKRRFRFCSFPHKNKIHRMCYFSFLHIRFSILPDQTCFPLSSAFFLYIRIRS